MIKLRGAEAVLRKVNLLGQIMIAKTRIPKTYRIIGIDKKLRTERTRVEARLLHKAKLAGVSCPTVFEVSEFEIIMSLVNGNRPKMNESECFEAGVILAKLHNADIIHGDYTPANLILESMKGGKKGMARNATHFLTVLNGSPFRDTVGSFYVIDFGLGFISNDIEDKAVDVFTMLNSIKHKNDFAKGYSECKKYQLVLDRVKKIEKRVRYAT